MAFCFSNTHQFTPKGMGKGLGFLPKDKTNGQKDQDVDGVDKWSMEVMVVESRLAKCG